MTGFGEYDDAFAREEDLPFDADSGKPSLVGTLSPASLTTDVANAERMAARCGDRIRFVHAWKTWYVWDGRRWAADDTGAIVRLAKDTVRSIYFEAGGEPDDKARAALSRHAVASEREARLQAMIRLTSSERGIASTPRDFDGRVDVLNVANGIVELPSGELSPHAPGAMLTKLADVSHASEAQCPRWLAFLNRVLAGATQISSPSCSALSGTRSPERRANSACSSCTARGRTERARSSRHSPAARRIRHAGVV